MEYVFLTLLALTLGAGVAGGLLSAWSCHRRLLALEENCKLLFTAQEDRLNQLQKMVVRQDKQEAVKTRWNKADREAEQLLALAKQPAQAHPWDPRTWGNSSG